MTKSSNAVLDRINRTNAPATEGGVIATKVELLEAQRQLAALELQKIIHRTALISENLEDKTGIESKVEVIEPISKREHERERLRRSRFMESWFGRGIVRRVVPGMKPRHDIFPLGRYVHGEAENPARPQQLPVDQVMFELKRESRGWVRPFVHIPDVTTRRRPDTPKRLRADDLIIEIPERGDRRIKSWLGGAVAYDGKPDPGYSTRTINGKIRTVPEAPRIIGVGNHGDGTYFTPSGYDGVSKAFYRDSAIEGLTHPASSDYIDTMTARLKTYSEDMSDLQNRILDRIGEENGADRLPKR